MVHLLCISISGILLAQTTFGPPQIISTDVDGPRCVHASDLDGDGDIDVLSASESDNKIACYKNNGSGNFKSQQIISTNAIGASSVYAIDFRWQWSYRCFIGFIP